MAKADIVTRTGTRIKVEGTPEEIATVLADLRREEERAASDAGRAPRQDKAKKSPKPGRVTLVSLVEGLIGDGFFRQPRDLGSIKKELDARAHFYPVTTLSGAVLREVRKRNLRRLKKDQRWLYTR